MSCVQIWLASALQLICRVFSIRSVLISARIYTRYKSRVTIRLVPGVLICLDSIDNAVITKPVTLEARINQ